MTNFAEIGLIAIFSFALIFHTLVLLKVIPYNIVWGGRLTSDSAMYKFEAGSLVINSLFLLLILTKVGHIPLPINSTVLTICLWLMAGLFFVNTIGNLLSKNKLERAIFTPLTILTTIFTVVLALH